MRIQVYQMPLDGCKTSEINIVGSLVFKSNESDEITGFVSGTLPDNCVEVTLFDVYDVPEYPGFTPVAERIPDSDLRDRMLKAASVNDGFAEFLRGIFA